MPASPTGSRKMTDPWADVREKATTDEHDSWCISWANEHLPCDCHLADLRSILAGADALLAVVPYATHHFGCPGGYKGKPDECVCGLDEILAVLPEHLRSGQ